VEAKQVAQQEAEMAKWIVDKALEEKKSIIITAQVSALPDALSLSRLAFCLFCFCCFILHLIALTDVCMQGEAEAAKLIASAVQNNPGFVELREIQYAKDVATTIANSNFKVRIPLR